MIDHITPINDEFDEPAKKLEGHIHIIRKFGITKPIAFSGKPFPHSAKTAKGKEIVLQNGAVTIGLYSRLGLSYGHYLRLIVLWIDFLHTSYAASNNPAIIGSNSVPSTNFLRLAPPWRRLFYFPSWAIGGLFQRQQLNFWVVF